MDNPNSTGALAAHSAGPAVFPISQAAMGIVPVTSKSGRRLRSDSTWYRLTVAQRVTVDGWLFEEGAGYGTVQRRLAEQWGVRVSRMAVQRLYRVRAREREQEATMRWMLAQGEADPTPMGALCAATVRAVGVVALHLAREHPHKSRDLASMARVMLDHQGVELRQQRLASQVAACDDRDFTDENAR